MVGKIDGRRRLPAGDVTNFFETLLDVSYGGKFIVLFRFHVSSFRERSFSPSFFCLMSATLPAMPTILPTSVVKALNSLTAQACNPGEPFHAGLKVPGKVSQG